MENLVRSCYIQPEKIAEKQSEMKEDIDLKVKYYSKFNITKDEFQVKEKFLVAKETPYAIPETEEKEAEKSGKPNYLNK